jgi:hypothetical protein
MKLPLLERVFLWRFQNIRPLPLLEDRVLRTLSSLRLAPHPKKRKTLARNIAAHAPQVKPNAYLPMLAEWPELLRTLRALTKTALGCISIDKFRV